MRRPGSGVSQSLGLRHGLDYALLVDYNCMSLLWRKRTPILVWRPGVVRYAGSFFVAPAGSFTPLSSMLFAQDITIQTPAGMPYHHERTTTNGYPTTVDFPVPGHTEHCHGVRCGPSFNTSSSNDSSRNGASCSGALSSPSTCNASSFRPPSCRGASAVCTPAFYDRQQGARHLPPLTVRAKDG